MRGECADVNQPQTDAKRYIVAELAARDHRYCGAPPKLAELIVAPETTAAVGRPSGNALRDPRALQTYQGGPRGASGW